MYIYNTIDTINHIAQEKENPKKNKSIRCLIEDFLHTYKLFIRFCMRKYSHFSKTHSKKKKIGMATYLMRSRSK